jgi:hypothetical protein
VLYGRKYPLHPKSAQTKLTRTALSLRPADFDWQRRLSETLERAHLMHRQSNLSNETAALIAKRWINILLELSAPQDCSNLLLQASGLHGRSGMPLERKEIIGGFLSFKIRRQIKKELISELPQLSKRIEAPAYDTVPMIEIAGNVHCLSPPDIKDCFQLGKLCSPNYHRMASLEDLFGIKHGEKSKITCSSCSELLAQAENAVYLSMTMRALSREGSWEGKISDVLFNISSSYRGGRCPNLLSQCDDFIALATKRVLAQQLYDYYDRSSFWWGGDYNKSLDKVIGLWWQRPQRRKAYELALARIIKESATDIPF